MYPFKLFSLLIPFCFLGCATLYVPDSRSTIIIEDAGELQADVSLGSSGIEIKTAYSISDYLGIGYSGSFLNRTNDAVFFKPHKHGYNELMGIVNGPEFGGFAKLSLTLGAGTGTASAYDDYVANSGEELSTEGDFDRLYLQPTIVLEYENIRYGLASRFSYVNFSEVTSSSARNRSFLEGYYFEPAFFMRTAGEVFRFIIQFGITTSIDNADKNAFTHEVYHLSAGLSLDLLKMIEKGSNN